MTEILGIHHVQITVPPDQVDSARDFYIGLLQLEEVEKPDSLKHRGGFWLHVGLRQVHIGVEEGFDRTTTNSHIAYLVDDLDYWREKLTDYGLTISESVAIPNYNRFVFRDPFGNRVEMIQPIDEQE